MIEELINNIRNHSDLRQSLSGLRAAVKEEENRLQAKEMLGDAEAVAELLKDEDPKVRKNAVLLLGDLCAKNQTKRLCAGTGKAGPSPISAGVKGPV